MGELVFMMMCRCCGATHPAGKMVGAFCKGCAEAGCPKVLESCKAKAKGG